MDANGKILGEKDLCAILDPSLFCNRNPGELTSNRLQLIATIEPQTD
jgi:hypothetical protein